MIKGWDKVINQANRLIKANQEIGRAIVSTHSVMSDRIFGQGETARGDLIGGGQYSPQYAAYRNKKGRDSYPITLRFTGAMERSFVCQPASIGTTWESGFTSSFEADKANWNEERYQQEIFMLSEQEIESLGIKVDKIITKALK